MTSKLHSTELCIYFSAWITANFYSLHKLFQAQSELLDITHEKKWTGLEPGWHFLSRYRDVSDHEWKFIKYFFQTSWYYLIFQFVISEIIRTMNKSYLKYWYILSSIIFVVRYMGVKQMIAIIAQPVLYLTIMFLGGGKVLLWLLSIGLLLGDRVLKNMYYFWDYFKDSSCYEQVYLISVCFAWIELRCISFCMEYIDRKDKRKISKGVAVNDTLNWRTVIDMLSYILYLPLLYTGPVILYEDFEKSSTVRSDNITKRLRRFISDLTLFLLYSFIFDLALHYIYFYAMVKNLKAITELPTMALCGGGLWMGLEFHMKYVICYGTSAAFARLDNMDAPPTPRCVTRIHVYSQMWKYFDVGLYKFLVQYIYKPSLSTISKFNLFPVMLHKLTASFVTFVFIFLWHGSEWDIFIWSALNFLSITLENLGKAISATESYKWFKKAVLRSDEMEIRFVAMVCTPLLILSIITSFYLFAGSKMANVYFARLLNPSICNSVIITFTMYSFCHVSIALQHVSTRTDVKKPQFAKT